MYRLNQLFISLQLACLLVLAGATCAAQPADPNSSEISFTVSMPKPWTHLFEVEVNIKIPANQNVPNETDLVFPVWTPGSYLVREFERHVQDFQARDANDRALVWDKTNKNTWRIKTNGARQWRATYRVYANELSVRTSELNADHAFWNNANLLMYPDGRLRAPSTVRVVPAPGWKVATGLPAVPGQANTFAAENFDILYDSPFEASNFKQIDFQVKGVPHRIVIDGNSNYDPERMRKEVQQIVEAETSLFGVIPYHDYTFFLHLRSSGGGGLEHLNSTALGFQRFNFANDEGWRDFDGLVAHEFFHVWNVKRIRPDALGPFDYTKENYTRMLWVAEGITEYYANVILARTGLTSKETYFEHIASQIQGVQNTPGRLEMSAEEASFNAWIKEYRPDENSVNDQLSYYDKGELLGLLLDLEIRARSKDAKSLDDVMRYLFTEFFQKDRNYGPQDFQKACELMAGSSLDNFFAHYVRGRDDLVPEYNQALAAAGLQLELAGVAVGSAKPDGSVRMRAFLGADLQQSGDFISITAVRAGSPAYEQGLNANDRIVALDNARVDRDTFIRLIGGHRPGDMVRITVFRSDDLRTFDIKLGARVDGSYQVVTLPQANAQQKRVLETWLGGK
jgi:predicted metalloprotease with PDZ domain